MTQVDYDYNFNKGYKDYDKISCWKCTIQTGADKLPWPAPCATF